MPLRRLLPSSLVLAALLLAACGNKGDLVRPTPVAAAEPTAVAEPAPE